MRKNLSVTAAVAFLALIAVFVPVAVGGNGNLPTIREYQNEKGNKITSSGSMSSSSSPVTS